MVSFNSIKFKRDQKGFLLLDVVVGVAISALILFAFTTTLYHVVTLNMLNIQTLKANLYASEVVEVTRELENSDWNQLSVSTCTATMPCRIDVQTGAWIIVGGTEILDDMYTRSLYIEDVYRDQLTFPNVIVSSPGELDSDTRKVVTTVSWDTGHGLKEVVLETYAYNY